jgi:hypothetical protein
MPIFVQPSRLAQILPLAYSVTCKDPPGIWFTAKELYDTKESVYRYFEVYSSQRLGAILRAYPRVADNEWTYCVSCSREATPHRFLITREKMSVQESQITKAREPKSKEAIPTRFEREPVV